ncbi:MAG: GNAT family N-acetyltransferase [Woeseiaceae bacterium]|nr:GNAT family N-acetyltransferase [Woeseiaceae bacterium]
MDTSTTNVRGAAAGDAADIARIYNHYIEHSHATFETDPVHAGDMADRIAETQATSLPWLVAEQAGSVLGYAYASKWKGRCAYRYSVESTIYLDPEATGRGLGVPLYSALIHAVRTLSMHSMIGGIALPNDPSIGLHEKLGFRKIGQFVEVGYKFDRWIDVGYWQLVFED